MNKGINIKEIKKDAVNGRENFIYYFEKDNKDDVEYIANEIHKNAINGDMDFMVSLGIINKNNRNHLKNLIKYVSLAVGIRCIYYKKDFWLENQEWENSYADLPKDDNVEIGIKMSISGYLNGMDDDLYAGYY